MSNENKIPFDQKMRESESESLKRDLFRYLKYWKWIVLGAIISLFVSYIYLRYETNIYSTNAKIKILKKKDSGMDLSGLTGNSPMFDMTTINLQNEMEILLSRRILSKVVDNLNLTTFYYTTGRIRTNEIFGTEVPFKVDWLIDVKNNDLSNIQGFDFIYKTVDDNTFRLRIFDDLFDKNFDYGQVINVDGSQFVINKNPIYNNQLDADDKEIHFMYKSRESRTNSLKSGVQVEPSEDSEVLDIMLTGQSKERNESILNNLIKVFNQDGVDDDRQVALKTAEFVSNRLDMLESELDTVESNLVDFKRDSNFISEGSGSNLFSTYSTAEQKRADLENQLEISRFIQEEIKSNSQYSLLPGEVGLQNSSTNVLISNYNTLVLERNRIMTSSTESSPQVLELSQQLRLLNNNIEESIINYIRSIQISLQNMSSRERQFNSSIKAIPEKEKIAREIQRQQAVKENLYIFLLQKQVEADLSAAITAPIAKVVDFSYSGDVPISPRPKVVYLAGLVVGLAFPISILYLMYLFDTKVTSKEQILAKLDIPVIAEIPVNKEYEGKIVKATDNSNVAEAFRILRTNMNYLIPDEDIKSNCKVIFSTSSTKGEGKTFCAINAASVFASNNDKTLLIGSDLRNPQLHNYLGVSKKNVGLSSYLVDPELKINDVIFKTEKDINFDIILSGEIPPNPSELLNNGRLEILIAEAREIYDYVIIDTAPTMLVTDTLTIVDQADAIIYMVRANFTELKILRHIKELTKFNMQKNIGIAINAVDENKGYEYNYGYGYGYGVDTKIKKWYKF